jgi:hypothetical protein
VPRELCSLEASHPLCAAACCTICAALDVLTPEPPGLQVPLHLRHYSHAFIAEPRAPHTRTDAVNGTRPLGNWIPPSAVPGEIACGVAMGEASYAQMVQRMLAQHEQKLAQEASKLSALTSSRQAQLQKLAEAQATRSALQDRSGQVRCIANA